MRKLLIHIIALCSYITCYGQGMVTKIAKDFETDLPYLFWSDLRVKHPQVNEMKKAIKNRKPAMVIAANEVLNFSIRDKARRESLHNSKYNSIIENLYYITKIKQVFNSVEFFIRYDNEVNAGMYPDGTCIINTGLLEKATNDEEIVAVIAHEIAHFVLMHALNDFWRTAKAIRRNQTWASIGTGLAMGAYGASQINNAQYGVQQSNQAQQQMYNNIANVGFRIREEIGLRTDIFTRLRYMRETEEEADETAFWFLEKNGIDPVNYINFLKRIDENTPTYLKQSKRNEKYSDHPNMEKRIKYLDNLYKKYHDVNFISRPIIVKDKVTLESRDKGKVTLEPIEIGVPDSEKMLEKIKGKLNK